jgi:replicative DNA helicase
MRAGDIVLCMLSSEAKVDMNLIRRGKSPEEDCQKLVLAAGALHEAGIFIDDTPHPGATDIERKVWRMLGSGLDLLVVDGLGALRPESGEPGMAAVLERLAREYGIPVLVTAPLGRGPDERSDHRPVLGDLQSPSVAEAADLVLLLYREDYYDPGTPRRGACEVIVAKNRWGPTGTVELAFLKPFTRFENPVAGG